MDIVLGNDLVVTFTRDGGIVDRFYCSDGKLAWRLALIVIATHGDALLDGDELTVKARRRPNLIERELG
jgi:hypothetical protein